MCLINFIKKFSIYLFLKDGGAFIKSLYLTNEKFTRGSGMNDLWFQNYAGYKMLERNNLSPEMISDEELKLEPFIHQVS